MRENGEKMNGTRGYYTPRSIIQFILNLAYKEEYKQLILGCPDQQVFPPLPTGDEVLHSLRVHEELIFMLEASAAKRSKNRLTRNFFLQYLYTANLRDIANCALYRDLRPLFFCLKSPAFRAAPVLLLLLEDCVNRNLKTPKGRRPERDRWKYLFAKHWLKDIEGYRPDKANMQLETFFVKGRSTVQQRIQELANTDDEARIIEIVDIAAAYPEMREQYLDAYCGEFKALFGHG